MADETEQKFLDAALKIFAQKGYNGATTKAIAQEAEFNEMTLFRRFKNKKNLFNCVLIHNMEKLKGNFDSTLKKNKCEDSKEFLRTLITDLAKIAEDNFEFISLTMNERSMVSGPLIAEFVNDLGAYIEKNIKIKNIDYNALALSIFSFTYVLSIDKQYGRDAINHQEILEGFIENSILYV